MSWAKIFAAWRHPSEPAASIESEIDEELMFHLRSLVDDNIAAGMDPNAAWRNAQDRFGSLRRYSDACRREGLSERLLSPGLAVMGLVAVGLLIGWLLFEVRSLRHEQISTAETKLREAVQADVAAAASRPAVPEPVSSSSPDRTDLAGRVLDHDGKPIDAAEVFVILKTWPYGSFHQEDFATTSDRSGAFRLPDLIPADGQVGLLVAAVKDGHALTSTYQLRRDGDRIATDDISLRLDDAPLLTLIVQDSRGRPVEDAHVLPSSRRSSDGEDHFLYFQGSEPLQATSDAEGRVGLSCFERGDRAEIYVRLPGEDWRRHFVRIPSDRDVITISTNPAGGAEDKPEPAI